MVRRVTNLNKSNINLCPNHQKKKKKTVSKTNEVSSKNNPQTKESK